MTEMMAEYGLMLLWAGVAVATFAVEAATTDMVSIWFTPGAVVAMILSIWVDAFWIQLLIFLALSAILLLFVRRIFRKRASKSDGEPMNVDAVLGKLGVVQEQIDNLAGTGSVKVGSLVWTARSADGSVIPAQSIITVKEVEGVKLICELSDKDETETN